MNVLRKLLKKQTELEYLLAHGMRMGKNSHLYSDATIDHTYPHLISIGDNVTISTNVTILAHDASTNVVGAGTKLGRVSIGNNVFSGTGTIILCNTHIGNNVVVGAGSIVTCDLPDNGVYAGAPARKVCAIEEYREKMHKLRSERPDLSQIRPWDQWANASEEDRKKMRDALEDGVGFI